MVHPDPVDHRAADSATSVVEKVNAAIGFEFVDGVDETLAAVANDVFEWNASRHSAAPQFSGTDFNDGEVVFDELRPFRACAVSVVVRGGSRDLPV
jgi:hypothetical protein